MKKLDQAGLIELRERFGNLHDAVIWSIQFNYPQTVGSRPGVVFEIDVIQLPWRLDPEISPNYILEWKKLTIEVRDLKAYRIQVRQNFGMERAWEVVLGWKDDLVYMDFDRREEFDAEDYSWLDLSECFALGKELWWEINEWPKEP